MLKFRKCAQSKCRAGGSMLERHDLANEQTQQVTEITWPAITGLMRTEVK